MRIKGKRGQALLYGLMGGLIVAIIVSYIGNAIDKKNFGTIGEISLKIIGSSKQAEKSLFYLDQSSKLSAWQSAYDLAGKGGFLKESECGSYFGFAVWQTIDKDKKIKQCFPKQGEIENNFKSLFLENLNEHLRKYSQISSVTIPLDNYDVELKDKLEIMGKAKKNLEIPIATQKQIDLEIKQQQESENAEYSYVPEKVQGLVSVAEVSCSGSCKVKEDVNERLVEANKILKETYNKELHVYSSYRSLEYQKALWEGKTPEKYAQRYPDVNERRKYVCDPTGPDASVKCPHLTGGAVDLRLKRETNSQMTPNDWDILADVMFEAGFVRYEPEKWHFEYGTERYTRAKTAGVNEIV